MSLRALSKFALAKKLGQRLPVPLLNPFVFALWPCEGGEKWGVTARASPPPRPSEDHFGEGAENVLCFSDEKRLLPPPPPFPILLSPKVKWAEGMGGKSKPFFMMRGSRQAGRRKREEGIEKGEENFFSLPLAAPPARARPPPLNQSGSSNRLLLLLLRSGPGSLDPRALLRPGVERPRI